jgi:hypothetical protein
VPPPARADAPATSFEVLALTVVTLAVGASLGVIFTAAL